MVYSLRMQNQANYAAAVLRVAKKRRKKNGQDRTISTSKSVALQHEQCPLVALVSFQCK